jgi:hypothetical protein
VSRCTLCDATVDWKTTVSGLRMPIDPAPHPAGHIAILPNGCIFVIPLEDRGDFDATRYMSHWSTCPAQAAAKQGAAKPK